MVVISHLFLEADSLIAACLADIDIDNPFQDSPFMPKQP